MGETLPTYRPPPHQKITVSQSTNAFTGRTTTSTNTGFDVYSGRRFDGQSASIGTNLGPPPGWKSKTESDLDALKRREKQITKQLQNNSKNDNSNSSGGKSNSASSSSSSATTTDRQW